MTTKECILNESLELFSVSGYEAVSMRDIGKAVGIRESSIYKHYSGKQAILDEIVAKAMGEIDHMLVELQVPDPNLDASVANYLNMSFEDIAKLCTDMLLKQRSNPLVAKFRRLLTIEQYRNETLRKIYIENFMERQLAYNEKVFAYLLKLGVLRGTSAQMMSLEFYAPFFMLQYRMTDEEEKLEEALQEYVIHFLREHLKEEETK